MRKAVKRGAVLAAAIGATTTVGLGIASWQATGVSVSGGETAGTSLSKQGLTLVTSAPAGLYPTQANAGNIVATITNPNPYNVTLTGASVTAVTGCAGITLNDFTFGTPVLSTALATKGSGAPGVVTIPISAVANSLPDACAASPIAFRVSASGASS
jgi:hypothetical protein